MLRSLTTTESSSSCYVWWYCYFSPVYRGAEYCDQSVCLSVCLFVREHISGTAGPIFTKVCLPISRGRGSVLLWRRYDMLCTSGFMDDVTCGRIRPYGETWRLKRYATTTSGVAILWRSLMSTNACLHCSIDYTRKWGVIIRPDASVCQSVLFGLNFLKVWPRSFTISTQVHLQNI